jgi:hypothetical protein
MNATQRILATQAYEIFSTTSLQYLQLFLTKTSCHTSLIIPKISLIDNIVLKQELSFPPRFQKTEHQVHVAERYKIFTNGDALAILKYFMELTNSNSAYSNC